MGAQSEGERGGGWQSRGPGAPAAASSAGGDADGGDSDTEEGPATQRLRTLEAQVPLPPLPGAHIHKRVRVQVSWKHDSGCTAYGE